MPAQPGGEIAAFHPEIGDLGQATLPEVGEHGRTAPSSSKQTDEKPGPAGHQHQFLPSGAMAA